jgi:hypothetical protein
MREKRNIDISGFIIEKHIDQMIIMNFSRKNFTKEWILQFKDWRIFKTVETHLSFSLK